MHILFLADNFPPETNAAATRVYERACYWVKWGLKVTVITCAPNFPQGKVYPPYKNKWYQTENMDGIRVIRVKTFIAANKGFLLRIIDFISFMWMAFFAGLFPKKPDIIISTSPQFFCAISGWMLAKIRGKPFIFELSDLWPDSIMAVTGMKKNLLIRAVEKMELFLYRQSAAVIALTRAFKQNLINRGIVADKIHIIRNGVDLHRYNPQAKDSLLLKQYALEDKFIVGYIGTHGMAHALMNVVHSASILMNQCPQITFVLIGDGAEKEALMLKAQQLALNNIIFIASQAKNILPKFWALCDVALIHLKNSVVFESVIPSKIFEAMAMGLPLLFSGPSGEASQIIAQHQAGVCISAEDPQELADAVIYLNQDRDLLKQFATNSKNAAPLYQREYQAQEVINVLKNFTTIQE